MSEAMELLGQIKRIVAEIVSYPKVVTAILFGPWAQGTVTPLSDVDPTLITPQFLKKRPRSAAFIRLWGKKSSCGMKRSILKCGGKCSTTSLRWTIFSKLWLRKLADEVDFLTQKALVYV
jgi:hypothetical protein